MLLNEALLAKKPKKCSQNVLKIRLYDMDLSNSISEIEFTCS